MGQAQGLREASSGRLSQKTLGRLPGAPRIPESVPTFLWNPFWVSVNQCSHNITEALRAFLLFHRIQEAPSIFLKVVGFGRVKGWISDTQFGLLQKLSHNYIGEEIKFFVEMELLDCRQISFMCAPYDICLADIGKWFTVWFPRDRLPGKTLASAYPFINIPPWYLIIWLLSNQIQLVWTGTISK